MNVFKMNQIAFGRVTPGGNVAMPLSGRPSPSRPRQVFQLSRKPSDWAIFLVSFLTYLIGIFPSMVFALPTDPTVQSGSVTIDTVSPEKMNIYQGTTKAIIDWNSFNINTTEHVDFQLSQGGMTLNRITGNDPSHILGKLSSNGDLWVVNPNGIVFGNNSQVDVRGLVATTSNITNSNFLSGNYNFDIPSSFSNTIVNQGIITAAEGGLVALVAPGVKNLGVINARLGKVSLASGKTFTLDLYGDQLINLGIDSKVVNQVTGMDGEVLSSLITNSGSIFADGGVVQLGVNAAQDIVDHVINMDGVIQAQSVMEKNGKIILMGGDEGDVHISGTLDASGYNAGETGGEINVLGHLVGLYGTGFIDVSGDSGGGTLLFGGDYQGNGVVPNAWDTFIGPDAQIFADAVNYGDGGRIIFWADRRMLFHGIVKGRGGKYFGDGGFVEVSGKEELFFDGSVDTSAANGKTGILLLDPDTITVSNGSGTTTASGASTFTTIFENTLEAVGATTNIILQADNEIIISDLSDNNLSLKQGNGNTVTFRTLKNSISKDTNGNITTSTGAIRFLGGDDTITTQGGDIIFEAKGDLVIGGLTSNGGSISLTGRTLNLVGTLNSGAGDVTIGSNANIFLGGSALSGCGVGFASLCDMSIEQSELDRVIGNKLTIGGTLNGDITVDGVTLTSYTGGVVLDVNTHVSGSEGAIIFQADSSFSSLEAKAVNGINANANITTTTGALSLNGDSDSGTDSLNPKDNITFASGVSLNSATSISLSAITGGMTAAAGLTLTAPTSITMTGNLTAAGTVGLTASSGINLNGGISTSSGNLSINANSSVLTLGSGITLSSAGALTLSASNTSSAGTLVLTSTGSTINIDNALVSTGNVTMTANSGLTLSNSTLTASGNINLQGGSFLSLASGMNISGGDITLGGTTITANSGSLTLNSTGSINVNNSLSSVTTTSFTSSSGLTMAGLAANGTVNLNSGTGTTTISGALSTTNNALAITASDLSLTGSINVGTSATTISVSNSGALGLGFTSGFSGMNLSNAELALITGDLNLVNSSITVATGTSVNLTGKLVIGQSGGSITGQGAMTLAATNGLAIDSSINAVGNLALDGDSNNSSETGDGIALASGVSLTSSGGTITLDATNGGITAPGAVTLNAAGVINLNDDFTAAGAITIQSNGLTIGGTTLSSGTASTTFLTSVAGTTIGLCGAVCAGSFGFSLTSTEFAKISAGSLIIGDSTNGNIIVEGITTSIADVTLNATNSSGRSVTFNTGTSNFQGLTVNASNGIVLSSGVTTQGATSFNSDTDAETNIGGDFTLAVSQSLSTTNNSLSITANDIALGAGSSISSGTADTTLLAAKSGRTIGLGAGAGDFSLSSTELGLITAANIIIGNSSNGTITVAGLTSPSTPLTLNATSTGSAVNFATTASTGIGSVTINAGTGGVDFGVDVTTTGSLTVNSDAAIAGTGILTIAGTASFNTTGTSNATVVSNSALTLGASTVGGDLLVTVGGDSSLNVNGAIQTGGNATLRADDDIIFTADGDITTTTGNIIVTADNDSDNNGSGGAITMNQGTTFSSSTGTQALSADEDITLGLLTTSNSSTTSITLTSTNGGVRDGDTASLDISTGGRLVADLVTGFGTEDNAIETNLVSVDIDNTTSGDINIFELNEIDIFKIDHAGVGNIRVSFIKTATNQQNATAAQGSVLFTRRDTGNIVVPGTGKTLKTLTDERTLQFFTIYENIEPTFLPIDRARDDNPELPSLDMFSDAKALLEIDEETAVYFDGLEKFENVWEGTGVENTQIAERKRSSRRVLSKRPKTTFEKEQMAEISFRKSPQKTSTYSDEISGKERASYQSPRKNSKPPKPLFSLSQANSFRPSP
ncbi:MAG: filamentous hemagglutinin N-terminal domain-containing protein [Nitrospinae bacterium]|nr:filamentous hemagglutinin N-terminal domain-containing protein [Nitrospinota bacterium]